jgi:hypothetical protein
VRGMRSLENKYNLSVLKTTEMSVRYCWRF